MLQLLVRGNAMFGRNAREFPHLVWYLDHMARASDRDRNGERGGNFFLVLFCSLLFLFLGRSLPWDVSVLIIAVATSIAAAWMIFFRKVKPKSDPRVQEAKDVAMTMRQCIDRRRLHRDLDEGSLILIEECARQWARIQSTFSTGFWQNTALPAAYVSAKRQALASAEEAMQDVMILYRPCLPQQVHRREPIDYMEEAAEQFGFGKKKMARHVPVAFGPVRQIADRLQQLASEAEQISQSNDIAMSSMEDPAPSTGIEASLGELRAIRIAEEELRQNSRG